MYTITHPDWSHHLTQGLVSLIHTLVNVRQYCAYIHLLRHQLQTFFFFYFYRCMKGEEIILELTIYDMFED